MYQIDFVVGWGSFPFAGYIPPLSGERIRCV